MKRALSTGEKDGHDTDCRLTPVFPNEVVTKYILPHVIPRVMGTFACVNRLWKKTVPGLASVCYANVLVDAKCDYPAVIGYGATAAIATLLRDHAPRDCDILALSAKEKWLRCYEAGFFGSIDDGGFGTDARETCAFCDEDIIVTEAEPYYAGFWIQRTAPNGQRMLGFTIDFHPSCIAYRKDNAVRAYLARQIQKTARRMLRDRFRILDPGMGLSYDAFRRLSVDALQKHRDAGKTDYPAFWNLSRAYPPLVY